MRRMLIALILFSCMLAGRTAAQSPDSLPPTSTPVPHPTSVPTLLPSRAPVSTVSVIGDQPLRCTPMGENSTAWHEQVQGWLQLWVTWHQTRAEWIQASAAWVEVVLVIITLLVMCRQLRQIRRQLDQNLHHRTVELSIEQNWRHLINEDCLPEDLPYWQNLSTQAKRWRVFLLNHLNLLYLVYEDHDKNLVDGEKLQDWKNKSTWILGDVCKAESPGLAEGRAVLQQLLTPEEGVGSRKFRRWLREESVVPPDLFPAADD